MTPLHTYLQPSVRPFPWHISTKCSATGFIFDDCQQLRTGESLIRYFAEATTTQSLHALLRKANGHFAIILVTEHQVLAAVDIIRSIPLFYSIQNQTLLISDQIHKIQDRLGSIVVDNVAEEEFLRVGYVLDSRTLDPRISQIQPGESITYDILSGKLHATEYFSHLHDNYSSATFSRLVKELNTLTNLWTQRLLQSAQGRPLLIPLSGGYDSRYVLCALKRAQYTNVTCYSYGTPTSSEHHMAARVAETLGYPIHIIHYDAQGWRSILRSNQFSDYCKFASQHCTVPHIQDFLALHHIKDHKLAPSDAIVVPGYCGDVQGGSYIPKEILSGLTEHLLSEGLPRYILRRLFDLRRTPLLKATEQTILSRIDSYTSQFPSSNAVDFTSVFEAWFTRHKLAKFVVNAVRAYEWFGFEWRLPLWDVDLIRWWCTIPLSHRMNSNLYHRFLFDEVFGPAGVDWRKPVSSSTLDRRAAAWLPRGLYSISKRVYQQSLKRIFCEKADLNAFAFVTALLADEVASVQPRESAPFGNVNGAVAAWCRARNF